MCSGGSRTDTGCRPHGPLVGRSLRVREARRHPDGSAAEQPDDTVIEGHGGGGPALTSHLRSVMGLMEKSLTRPRSWYMCSKQLSICGHSGRSGSKAGAGPRGHQPS